MPLLRLGGVDCVQSWAIVRHVARVSGMVPAEPALEWRADAVVEEVRDLFAAGNLVGFGWGAPEADAAQAAAAAAKFLPKFEALLGEGAPFVCGAAACYADYQLLYALNYISEVVPGGCVGFPRLEALRGALNATPRMAAFLGAGGAARGLVTPRYIGEVRAAQLPKAE